MTRHGLYISQVGLRAAKALREQAKMPRGKDASMPVQRPPDEIFRGAYDFDEAYLWLLRLWLSDDRRPDDLNARTAVRPGRVRQSGWRTQDQA